MRHTRFCINLLLLFVPLSVLVIGSWLLTRRVFEYLNTQSRLAGVLSTEATRALGRRVHVGDAVITGNLWGLSARNRIDLRNVMIADAADAGAPFARAERIVVVYNLAQLLFPPDPAAPYVDEVQLAGPEALIARDARGRWNFETLLRPKTAPGRPFADRIAFQEGLLHYADRTFPHPEGVPVRPLALNLQHLAGVVLFRPDRSVAFQADGAVGPAVVRNFHALGVVEPAPGMLDIRLTASAVSLPFLGERLISPARGHVFTGKADLDVGLVLPISARAAGSTAVSWQDMQLSGQLQVTGLSGSSPEIGEPVQEAHGRLRFDGGALSGRLAGRYAGAGIDLTGEMTGLDLHDLAGRRNPPAVALRGTLRTVDLGRALRALRLDRRLTQSPEVQSDLRKIKGYGDVQFQLGGTAYDPTTHITAQLSSLEWASYRARNVRLISLWANRRISADIRGSYARGDAIVRANVDLDSIGAFRLEACGAGLELAEAGLPTKEPLQGTGRLDLVMQGRRGHIPRTRAQIELTDVRFRAQSLAHVTARAETVGRALVISDLRAEDEKGIALAQGEVDLRNNRVHGVVDAVNLDIKALSEVLRPAGRPAESAARSTVVDGQGSLHGTLGGTLDNPILTGTARVEALQIGQSGLDSLTAQFDLSRDRLSIREGRAERYTGAALFSGAASDPFSEHPMLDLTFRADNVNAADLLMVTGVDTGDLQLTGNLFTGDVHLQGPIDRLTIQQPFTVRLDQGYLNGLPLGQALAQAVYGPDGLQIREAHADFADGALTARGTVGADGALDLTLEATGMDIETLALALPFEDTPEVGGTLARVQLNVQGKAASPRITGTLSAGRLTYEGSEIGDLQGSLRYADRLVTLENLRLTDVLQTETGRGRIDIARLDYDVDNHTVRATGSLSNVSLSRVRALFLESGYARTETGQRALDYLARTSDAFVGDVEASFSLQGTTSKPVLDLRWSGSSLQIAGYSVTALAGSARVTPTGILSPWPPDSTDRVRLETPDGLIVARRLNIVYDGSILADIDASNANLTFLQNLIRPEDAQNPARRLSGIGDLGLVITGATKSPEVEASLNLRNLIYGGQPIDRVDVDTITINKDQDGRLRGSLRLVKNDPKLGTPYEGRAGGSIGFSWSPPFIPSDAPLDITATVVEQPLQIVSALAPFFATLLADASPRAHPGETAMPASRSVASAGSPGRAARLGAAQPSASQRAGSAEEGGLVESEGTISVAARVQGTRSDPSLSGSLQVRASRLRIDGLATGLRDVVGDFALQGDRLEARSFSALSQIQRRTGAPVAGGPIRIVGGISLGLSPNTPPDAGGLRLTAENLRFDENPLPALRSGSVRGVGELDLRLTGTLRDPELGGTLTVHDAEARLPSEFGGVGGVAASLPDIARLNLRVRLDRRVRVLASGLNARTEGNLFLTGRLSDPRLQGNLTLPEGQLTLSTTRFVLRPGSAIVLRYPVYEEGLRRTPSLGVNVNLTAHGNLTATSIYGTRQRYRVTLYARGPLTGAAVDRPTGESPLSISFATDPPDLATSQVALSQRVLGALGGADVLSQFGRTPGRALTAELATLMNDALLPGVFERAAAQTGFEEIALTYDPVQRLNLTLSRNLFGPLYVTYIRSLSADREIYSLKTSLRFRNRYQVSYQIDEQRTQRLLLEGVWKF